MKSVYKYLLVLMVSPLFAMKLPEKQEKAAFDILPNEIVEYIIKALPTQARGSNRQTRLLNAAQDIRDLAQVDTRFRDLINDPKTVEFLIEELSNRYANRNKIAAAFALATSGAGKWLVDYTQNFNNMATRGQVRDQIQFAVNNDNLNIIKFVLHHIPLKFFESNIIYVNELLVMAIKNNSIDIVEWLLDNQSLVAALRLNDIEEAKKIIEWAVVKSINPNKIIIQKILAKTGYDINSINTKGETLLFEAVLNHGDPSIVEIMTSLGADVNKPVTTASGGTLLHEFAPSSYNTELIKSLLQAGANIEVVDGKGQSPLLIAALNSQLRNVELLLGSGAKVNESIIKKVRQHYRENIASTAIKKEQELIIKLLEDKLKK